jgi:hypothetical protein
LAPPGVLAPRSVLRHSHSVRLHADGDDSDAADRDGLLTIIVPDESGLDDAPKYDELYRWMRHDRTGHFWLLVPAMRELGYVAEADRVVRSLEIAVDRYGYREYYNPLTGRGLAARGFGFSTLLVDLLAHCGIDTGAPSGARRMMRP